MEWVVWLLIGTALLFVVIAFYALWETTFHSRNVQLILSGEPPKEHQGYTRTLCALVLGRRKR